VTTDDLRFAAAIAAFGQLLRDPLYLGDWGGVQPLTWPTMRAVPISLAILPPQ
jgi:hypothetical protein